MATKMERDLETMLRLDAFPTFSHSYAHNLSLSLNGHQDGEGSKDHVKAGCFTHVLSFIHINFLSLNGLQDGEGHEDHVKAV